MKKQTKLIKVIEYENVDQPGVTLGFITLEFIIGIICLFSGFDFLGGLATGIGLFGLVIILERRKVYWRPVRK